MMSHQYLQARDLRIPAGVKLRGVSDEVCAACIGGANIAEEQSCQWTRTDETHLKPFFLYAGLFVEALFFASIYVDLLFGVGCTLGGISLMQSCRLMCGFHNCYRLLLCQFGHFGFCFMELRKNM